MKPTKPGLPKTGADGGPEASLIGPAGSVLALLVLAGAGVVATRRFRKDDVSA